MSTPSIAFQREAAPGRARAAVSAPCRLCGADAALHFVRRHCDGEQLGAMARLAWHLRWLELAFVLSCRRSLAGHDNAVLRKIVDAGEGGAAADRRRS